MVIICTLLNISSATIMACHDQCLQCCWWQKLTSESHCLIGMLWLRVGRLGFIQKFL